VPRNVAVRNLLPEQYLVLLGEVALASAQLEYSIGSHISMLLNLSPVASECIITPMSLFIRLDVLSRIGAERIRLKKKLKEFDSLIQRLKKCAQDRNTAIHGRWWPEKEKMTLAEIFQMLEGTLQVSGYRAKNKKQILRANQLAKLAKDLDEGGTAMWAMAKSTWFSGRIDAVRRREVLKYERSKSL
jgi:hypothetical protein